MVGSYFVDCMHDSVRILNRMNPETLMKSVKNETEKSGMREAHVRDGVCMVKFLYWLKKNVGLKDISESEAADYLDDLRRETDGFLMHSFETISAYGKNAAMVHYHAIKGEDSVLDSTGLYLCDSGAHYVDGTTDVTRTISLGEISEEERFHFTIALKSLIALSDASFLYRTSCSQIDMFARGPLWQYGLDCPHTTGHGVGCVLDVHESPNIFAWQLKNPDPVISDGMVTSNEPGIYAEGSHGIRHENLLLAVKDADLKDGKQFMHFETLTLVPFDIEALDLSYLTKREIMWLDAYHEKVYETLSPFLSEEVRAWLKTACRPLGEK